MLVNNTIESSRRPGIPGPHRPDLKWFKDALDGKSDVGHVHQKKDITDFEHNHDGRYYRKDEHELQLLLSGNGTPNFNQGINGDYYVDELNGDLYKKSGDAWNLIIHLEGEQGIPGPQGNPGIRGPEGPTGKEGYTPVRGTDYWTPEDEEIIRQSIVSEVQLGLSGKVDKVEGKGLSTEDFTTLLKQKLEELQNYDDRDIRELLEKSLYNVTIDVKTGILTFHTNDESTFTVDLPLELIVSDGYLDNDTNTIVLVLANGNTIDIPVENLIRDFYGKAEVDQKIADLAEEVAIDFEAVAEDFNKVDEELAKAQAQIDALKAENEAQQKELEVLYNDLVPGEASGETAVVANGVIGSKVEIDGDGNTVQEVIEAVEGTTVTDTNMNLTDVDTTFENSILPMGNISQETREAYQLLSTDEANLTVVQGSDATHLQYYDDGFINAFNNVTDAETELIYTIPTKHITSGKKYTLGIEYKYTNRASIYLRNTANDESVKALNTNSASSIKLTNTANSNYMSVSVILKANSSATFRLTLAEGTEQKPWQTYDPDYVIPSLNYPSPVKGVGGQESLNKLNIYNLLSPNHNKIIENGCVTGYASDSRSWNYANSNWKETLEAGKYTVIIETFEHTTNTNVSMRVMKTDNSVITSVRYTALANKITVLNMTLNETTDIGVMLKTFDGIYRISILKGTYTSVNVPNYIPYGYCRYETSIGNKNIIPTNFENWESGDYRSSDGVKIGDISRIRLNEALRVIPNESYYFALNTTNVNLRYVIRCLGKNREFISSYGALTGGTKLTINNNIYYLCISIYDTQNVGIDLYETFKTMFENGNLKPFVCLYSETDRTFIEHQSQSLPIDIPVGQEWYSGKPYKLNGKWYRDVEWEKLYGKDLPWYFQNNENIDNINTNRFTHTIPTENADSTSINAYSNILPANTAGQLWINDKLGVARSISQVIIRVPAEITTKAQVQEYFGEDGYIVCKKTPTREEITDETLIEQLEALQNAEFYDGITNINSYPSSEDVAEMPLEAHYNFVTPAPSPNRDSEVEIAEAPNMFDKDNPNIVGGLFSNTTSGFTTGVTANRSLYLKIKPNTTYTVDKILSRFALGTSPYVPSTTEKVAPTNYIRDDKVESLSITSGANDEYLWLWLWNESDTNDYQAILDSLMIYEGTSKKPYLPYGHIGLVQRGKNRLNLNADNMNTANVQTIIDKEKSTITINGTNTSGLKIPLSKDVLDIELNKPYTVSLEKISGEVISNNNSWLFVIYPHGNSRYMQVYSTTKKATLTWAEKSTEKPYLWLGFSNTTAEGFATFENAVFKFQIEKDTTATEFEPYIEPIVKEINLNGNSIAKVGDIKDILNIGVDGRVSIEKKNIEVILDGVTNKFNGRSTINENNIYNTNQVAELIKKSPSHDNNKLGALCNYFKEDNINKLITEDIQGFGVRMDYRGFSVIFGSNSEYNTLEKANQFLIDNNVKIITQLAKTEIINLPSIEPIELFEGTNIFELITSLPTTLTAHYKVSSKKQLIENNDRITALEATVNTLLGGN